MVKETPKAGRHDPSTLIMAAMKDDLVQLMRKRYLNNKVTIKDKIKSMNAAKIVIAKLIASQFHDRADECWARAKASPGMTENQINDFQQLAVMFQQFANLTMDYADLAERIGALEERGEKDGAGDLASS